ncbi:hypothetical protein [Clostridium tarantellae]|uniref:Uncharacterized protein n=1 Tax=Clostridium tarantellae TaxID=39493 RepID=A0A6I1MPN4_9CLOT|nr:hypothetical protein [Clostridium tarantellae]MPQ44763.1 hypothetical protein [Clostridium tarantellae]
MKKIVNKKNIMNIFFQDFYTNKFFKKTPLGYIYKQQLTKKEFVVPEKIKNKIILYQQCYMIFIFSFTIILGFVNIFLPIILFITIPIYFLIEKLLIKN